VSLCVFVPLQQQVPAGTCLDLRCRNAHLRGLQRRCGRTTRAIITQRPRQRSPFSATFAFDRQLAATERLHTRVPMLANASVRTTATRRVILSPVRVASKRKRAGSSAADSNTTGWRKREWEYQSDDGDGSASSVRRRWQSTRVRRCERNLRVHLVISDEREESHGVPPARVVLTTATVRRGSSESTRLAARQGTRAATQCWHMQCDVFEQRCRCGVYDASSREAFVTVQFDHTGVEERSSG
jgi:hypothetical protein